MAGTNGAMNRKSKRASANTEPTTSDFRKELDRIPGFDDFEKCVEQLIADAPMDKSYEYLVAALIPHLDQFIHTLKDERNTAVVMGIMLAKLIEARRGFPA